MRLRTIIVSCAILTGFAACNDVPVRNLTSTYSVQMQALRDRGTPAKLDILWVVDDSSSMCQEQQNLASSFKTFLDVFQKFTAIDMQLAVTSTNVCPKGTIGGAVRGKFLYQPATTLSPGCAERRPYVCLVDSQCQAAKTGFTDPANWVCEVENTELGIGTFVCDQPAEIGDDGRPGDILFAFSSRCRYACDPLADATQCGEVFGMPDACKADGKICDGGCSTAECNKETSFDSKNNCPLRCRGRSCVDVCVEVTGDQADCATRCGKEGAECLDVCSAVVKAPTCDLICDVNQSCFDKCQTYFGEGSFSACQTTCQAASFEQCSSLCNENLGGNEFLCAVTCDNSYSCQDNCIAQFGDNTYRCECPGGDCTNVGCMKPPATNYCPGRTGTNKDGSPKWSGPTILNKDVADYYAVEWIKGNWEGPPSWDLTWKDLPTDDSIESVEARTILKETVFEHLFICMATVGANQSTNCGGQEQGLRAAWMALDPEGENAEQAKNFLRDDAYLLVVVISDEDDCSAPEYFDETKQVWKNYVTDMKARGSCPCERDENGCLASGECDYSKCLTKGSFDRNKCQLYSSASMVNKLRSLKADPAQVVFSAIVGDAVPGSITTPADWDEDLGGPNLDAVHERFYDCRCQGKQPEYVLEATYNYICSSFLGTAEYGKRYIDVAEAFGLGRYGQVANICSEVGIGPSLEDIANLVVPLLTRVCLPRPMEWSCQGKCEATFSDAAKCSEVCAANECFAECQTVFGGEPGCADICRSRDYIDIFKYDNKGECATKNADGTCVPLEMITESNPDGDYRLVKNAPSCPLFDLTMGERPENAIEFKSPLGYTDKLEIVYRADANFCHDRCVRIFKDENLCLDVCAGDTDSCVEKCIKITGSRSCSYVCEVSTDTCLNQCIALDYEDCTAKCE